MSETSQFYLLLTLLCLVLQGTFAMLEMACVSFNKMRLQYYLGQGSRRAKWLNFLIHKPARLFGTTLIGLNATLVIGSECSRRLYESLGLSPDFAPLSQIILVLLFAEISPMLAGRRHAEHVGLLGAPFLLFLSFLFRPVIFALDLLCQGVNWIIGSPVAKESYLSREELQNIIEEREETILSDPSKQEQTTVANIFSFKSKTAKDLMLALSEIPSAPIFASAGELRALLHKKASPFILLYQRNPHNIVAVAYPRDLLRLEDHAKIKENARPPWFITENASILQILKQFRHNNQNIAVVLSSAGHATGLLTLDRITDEIFGLSDQWPSIEEGLTAVHTVVVDRTFPADFSLEAFNQQFGVHLSYKKALTLGEVMEKALGHPPAKGESIRIDQFELIVEEASLLAAKEIWVRTITGGE